LAAVTLTVTSACGGLYWWRSSRIEGIAIPTRISTGTSVQITSISVLCELRDGVGLAPRRKRTSATTRRTNTSALIAAQTVSSRLLWKAAASLPMGVT